MTKIEQASLSTLPISVGNTIPVEAELHSLREVSKLLTKQYGRGFQIGTLRRQIHNGKWIEGQHYQFIRGQYKVYLPAVRQWAMSDSAISN